MKPAKTLARARHDETVAFAKYAATEDLDDWREYVLARRVRIRLEPKGIKPKGATTK